MKRLLGLAVALAFSSAPALADEAGAKAVVDKAVKALGGEEALNKAKAFAYKSKGTLTINGNASEFSSEATTDGLDRHRAEFSGSFNGNEFKAVTVLAGDKGWRKFGDDPMELGADDVANEKRSLALIVAPVTLAPLRDKAFKVETAGEEMIGGKPAAKLKVTGPDGKDFTISFDKETGLPVKQAARVTGFGGQEFDQVSTFRDYKEMGGLKKATKVESTRDGEPFLAQEVTEFKPLDKVDPATFNEPK